MLEGVVVWLRMVMLVSHTGVRVFVLFLELQVVAAVAVLLAHVVDEKWKWTILSTREGGECVDCGECRCRPRRRESRCRG